MPRGPHGQSFHKLQKIYPQNIAKYYRPIHWMFVCLKTCKMDRTSKICLHIIDWSKKENPFLFQSHIILLECLFCAQTALLQLCCTIRPLQAPAVALWSSSTTACTSSSFILRGQWCPSSAKIQADQMSSVCSKSDLLGARVTENRCVKWCRQIWRLLDYSSSSIRFLAFILLAYI